MNISEIEAFVAVVEAGSVIGAAERLRLTQPGITRRIRQLEHSLRTELLDRRSKPLKPTSAGLEVYESGLHLLAAAQELKARASRTTTPPERLALGLTTFLPETALAKLIGDLRRELPAATLQTSSEPSALVMQRLRDGDLDAALICLDADARPPDCFDAVDLGLHPMVIAAARTLNIPPNVELADLSDQSWVISTDCCLLRAAIKRRMEAARRPFHVVVESVRDDYRLHLIAQGIGIGYVTKAAFDAYPKRALVEALTIRNFAPAVRLWFISSPAYPMAILCQTSLRASLGL